MYSTIGCCSILQYTAVYYRFYGFPAAFWCFYKVAAILGPKSQWILPQKTVSDTVFIAFSQKIYALSGRDNSTLQYTTVYYSVLQCYYSITTVLL